MLFWAVTAGVLNGTLIWIKRRLKKIQEESRR